MSINSPTMNDKRAVARSPTTGDAPVTLVRSSPRIIADFATVPYPEGVSGPHPDLNRNAKDGKFRYDRDFLLQFMEFCQARPATLPPLDAIGLEPGDHSHAMSRGRVPTPIGLGFNPSTLGKPSANSQFGGMGNFATMGAGNELSSEERYANSNRAASVSGAAGLQYTSNRPSTLQRTTSEGGAGAPLQKRIRSKPGENRNENNRVLGGSGGQGHGSGFNNNMNQMQNLDPVVPLQATENRWVRKAIQVEQDSPELVERKVKGLLNKLTMEKFASISDQIIAWANKSEKEKDGRTLIQVIRLIFEEATDEAILSGVYARLCRKMMEQISTNVQDDGIKNVDGKPITGGQLFRKYLLNRCQEDFERGWVAKEATAAAAATKALEDEAAKAANAQTKEAGTDEIVLYSEEYCAPQKAKRQGLGLIKFIGELFKLQMLTERIMHECVKTLLGNVDNPEEEEIESLCKLLATVGSILDTQKARAHLDVYFSRMKWLTESLNVTPRMQYMLQDLLELRERKWVARNAVAAPTTIAQVHENAAKEKASQEKESYQRQISMSRGGSRRGGDRGEFSQPAGPDGWAVAGNGSGLPRPPPKAGDLSNFGGKISKAQPLTFGPSSVFAGKKGAETRKGTIPGTNSSSNMFSMLSSQTVEASDKHKSAAAAEPLQQRKRLVLQPLSVPVEATSLVAESESSHLEEEASMEMTEESALKQISEDLKEFFAIRNLEEAEAYFSSLPPQYHYLLVDKIVSTAVESKEDDADLVSQFFALAASKGLCSPISFEQGLTPVAEIIDDIAIDAPKAFQLLATMVKGSGLDQERLANLASKSVDSDKFLGLHGLAVTGCGSGLPRLPLKAGDISNFGKISKAQSLTPGPSDVFAGKKGADNNPEAISQTNSSSNMFSMLSSQTVENATERNFCSAMPALPFDKLTESNYDDWKILMEALLEEMGLFGVVSGRDIMPTTGPNSKGVKTFLKKQRLAWAKIILAIDSSQLPHVRNEDDPAVIWMNLARIHHVRGLGVLLRMRMDFLKMTMPPQSTISTYVARIRHAAYRLEECYQAEEKDSFLPSLPVAPPFSRPPIISELDKITVLFNGLPPFYQSAIVNITGISLASLSFENVVTRLMNEEGRLRNVVPPTSSSSDPLDEAIAVTPGGGINWKGKPSKFTSDASRKPSQIMCHKCGGVGHIRPVCPTQDSDAIANVVDEQTHLVH